MSGPYSAFTLTCQTFLLYAPPLILTSERASCSELTVFVSPLAVVTTNWAGCPFLLFPHEHMSVTPAPFLWR